jgi:diguanylate cyclase (GGDEF)-like protein
MRWRDPVFVALAGVLLLVAAIGAFGSTRWVDRPFAGFLLLENRVVASAGLTSWPGTATGEIYQHELIAVDGRPLARAEALQAYVETLPIGTPVHYRLRSGDGEIERVIATQRFTATDWTLLFGLYLLNGLAIGGVALCIWFLRGGDRVSRGIVIPLWNIALWALTATDLYGPYHWFRIHAGSEGLLFAGAVHIALVFPRPGRWIDERPICIAAPYLLAIPLAIAIQWGLASPSVYVVTHAIATTAFGLGLVALIGSQLAHFLFSSSFEVRQRIKVVALGTALALGPQAVLALGATLTGGRTPQNLMAFTGALFPISIGYALVRQNLLGVDELVRRSLNYGLLSIVLTLSYATALAGAELLLGSREFQPGTPATLTFVFFGSLALLPLRDRLQGVVDRVFFRSAYDFRQVVERASEKLASTTDLRAIADELTSAIGGALQCEWHALYVRVGEGAAFQSFNRPAPDEARQKAMLAALESATQPIAVAGRQLAVPVRSHGKLVAAFLLGPRQSGSAYGDDDRRLLQTLANQGSTAFQRAVVLERLRRMNRELEAHVEGRTKELNDALAELRQKNQQLTKLSVRDGLTDLYNRTYLDGVLEREFARAQRRSGTLTILMIDVDHFKRVNDTFGHPTGDAVLRRVAEVLERNSRTSDVVGRYGGEEFMAILCQPEGTRSDPTLPERLRREIEQLRFEDSGFAFTVTVSIGVAAYYPGCTTVEDLVSAADVALYRAKRAGRNRVVALGQP